ncbi:Cytochrome c1 heme lyase [Puccinia graminis f. sp. tritici]|uniref:Holocytochrome c-type synthase n=1 Tax=Puccinia graminis f. sp. tritici TaxID=56615 RepID=A0A5B0RDR4_PUCGR|nr:Cytochrome c1 heme lyase [Puccinia graminis f. sp. tritici]
MWPFSTTASTSASQGYGNADQATCPIDHRSKIGDQGKPKDHLPVLMADSNRLPTDRVISSIPRYRPELNENNQALERDGTRKYIPNDPSQQNACPVDHQTRIATTAAATTTATTTGTTAEPQAEQNWIYPSPSQFYNALKRKNRNPRAEDMYTVVPIHNAVNERVWRQVLEWEAGYGRGSFDRWPRSGKSGPMLCSFRGRPDDLSPRAWIKVLSGYQAPFDRHDWEVIRPTEEKMRYVVDFYPGKGADSSTVQPPTDPSGTNHQHHQAGVPNLSFYLDVRPALDSWEGVRMRLLRTWDDIFSSPPNSPGKSDQKA